MKKASAGILAGLVVAVVVMFIVISNQAAQMPDFDSGSCEVVSDCENQVLNVSACPGSFSCVQDKCIWLCSENPVTAECVSDSNCAVSGCSSEVCASSANAKDIITTCNYKKEYSCLKKTSCGCVAGRCQWKNNIQYKSCMEDLYNDKQ